MTKIEEVNKVKHLLLDVCTLIAALNKDGIRVEFQITDGQLTRFVALQEMKLSQ
jgi:hypothetical protein